MKVKKLKKKLEKLDELRWDDKMLNMMYEHLFDDAKINDEEIAYELSTYLYDCDFDLDEFSWELFVQITDIFGPNIAGITLKNMFTRIHDT